MLGTTATIALLLTLAPAERPDLAQKGREVFHDPGVGKNGVSCANCHATEADDRRLGDGLIRSGHTLFGAARRPYWRGDSRRTTHRSIANAIDVCAQLFQGDSLEPERRALLSAFLDSISPRKAQPPLQIQPALEATLDYDRAKYRGGQPDRGRELFYRACHSCHPHAGAGLGPAIAGTKIPEVALRVREGNGLLRGDRIPGAWSPFFGRDRLNDDEVADIAAYVEKLQSK